MVRADSKRLVPRTGQEITALALGTAPLGGLYSAVSTKEALALIEVAWRGGIRYFDTAPFYGMGRAEHLLGHFLRLQAEEAGGSRPPSSVVSTKVGRLMQTAHAGRQLPPEAPKNPFDTGWSNGLGFREVFDYSYDAIMRSYEDSQQRLGFPEIDMLYVHDIGRVTHGQAHDFHWEKLTKGGGFKALQELKNAGDIKGFGLGVNEWEAICDALEETDLDCCLLAGRNSLLDQTAARALLPLAQKRQVAIIAGGVFNSGILAATADGDKKFNYVDAPAEILAKVERMRALCRDFYVTLSAAAIQFPLRHRAITSVVIGAKTAQQVQQNIDWFNAEIPSELWDSLASQGLIEQ